jgi:uncharacterized membrane protein
MFFLKLYVVALLIFSTVDLFWLGVIAKNLYREQIGFLMKKEISWIPAISFYGLYLIGLVLFAILPALKDSNCQQDWQFALLHGSLFGLVCYATYDLTNLATLKGWPIKIVIYDLIWGTFISGITTLLTFWIAQQWKNFFS